MKYRSRTDIIATILRTSINGATKTRIMYGAYLSYAQVKDYLNFLIEKQLISREEGTGLYRLTENGMRLLRAYEDISDLISITADKTTVEARGRTPAAPGAVEPITNLLTE